MLAVNIQGVLSTALTFLKDVTMSNFGGTPCIGMLTTGSAGMFRLRRRMRSDFAQHDSGNAANAGKGFSQPGRASRSRSSRECWL
jgi:hypothetical protein